MVSGRPIKKRIFQQVLKALGTEQPNNMIQGNLHRTCTTTLLAVLRLGARKRAQSATTVEMNIIVVSNNQLIPDHETSMKYVFLLCALSIFALLKVEEVELQRLYGYSLHIQRTYLDGSQFSVDSSMTTPKFYFSSLNVGP
jgi:hypothetical protein